MKKFFISAALLISVSGSVVHAHAIYNGDPVVAARMGNDKLSSRVQAAFKKEFTGASILSWERLKENIYVVQFVYKNERLNAFFDEEGQLVATGRFMNESSLPLMVKNIVADKYASYQLKQIIELTQNSETSYLLSFTNEQIKLEVQAYNNGNLSVIKKVKRNS
jgi:hypothetical protein